MYTGLKLDGGRELRSTLRKAGYDLKDLKATHRQAAAVVVSRAKGWVPRVSGNLAATIRPGATQRAAVVRAGNNRTSKSGVPYAAPIHWGWKARNIKANPFLSYSAQATEPTWVRLYEQAVDKALDQVKGI
ncbi:hypothetical protein GP475_09690 [Corynebacterium poyangense]|uniref:HK97 gp10 family phage protein n=1 Tax=Corynebacterium poyangense TaxID=2684405 RepID=A0A7H0SQQ6_9CORY|nr:hypothetical protein [Corynebacterium poyangense]QNQ90881.1 hypothetical protein GP475_09690 [Corynebacterium poyangense]